MFVGFLHPQIYLSRYNQSRTTRSRVQRQDRMEKSTYRSSFVGRFEGITREGGEQTRLPSLRELYVSPSYTRTTFIRELEGTSREGEKYCIPTLSELYGSLRYTMTREKESRNGYALKMLDPGPQTFPLDHVPVKNTNPRRKSLPLVRPDLDYFWARDSNESDNSYCLMPSYPTRTSPTPPNQPNSSGYFAYESRKNISSERRSWAPIEKGAVTLGLAVLNQSEVTAKASKPFGRARGPQIIGLHGGGSHSNENWIRDIELQVGDGSPNLAKCRLDSQCEAGFLVSSDYVRDRNLLHLVAKVKDPNLIGVGNNPLTIDGVLRNVTFNLRGSTISYRRDIFVCKELNGWTDMIAGAKFMTEEFAVLFSRFVAKQSPKTKKMFAGIFSSKKETEDERLDREKLQKKADLDSEASERARRQRKANREQQGTAIQEVAPRQPRICLSQTSNYTSEFERQTERQQPSEGVDV